MLLMDTRRLVQWLSAIISNAYFKGFASLSIYQGVGKRVCVPVLNCYSCPGALGSCPVGSMQSLLGGYKQQFSFYVAGLLTVVGAASGRLACGWLCPFGLVQELLARISRRKFHLPELIKKLKYLVLLLTVVLPVLWVNQAGLGSPYFCKFICPAGTLEAGLPLGLGRLELRALLGSLFAWKAAVLFLILFLSIIYFRPFCRSLCPLGAYYALFNRVSWWRLEINPEDCIDCGCCSQVCPVEINVREDPNSPECIRCLRCRDNCPGRAISFGRRDEALLARMEWPER
jgi:polyferredoxin